MLDGESVRRAGRASADRGCAHRWKGAERGWEKKGLIVEGCPIRVRVQVTRSSGGGGDVGWRVVVLARRASSRQWFIEGRSSVKKLGDERHRRQSWHSYHAEDHLGDGSQFPNPANNVGHLSTIECRFWKEKEVSRENKLDSQLLALRPESPNQAR